MKKHTIGNRFTNRNSESIKIYFSEINSYKVLTPDEEEICCRKMNNGDVNAYNELIKSNLRFVISIAKQYESTNAHLEDLINEGNMGLIHAASYYKVDRGFRFITFAVHWIRKRITDFLAKNNRIVRLPANKLNALSKYTQDISKLEQECGHYVEFNHVVDKFGDTMDIEELKELDSMSNTSFISMDEPVSSGKSEETDLLFYETQIDSNIPQTDFILIGEDERIVLTYLLNKLKPRDKFVMVKLYGLDGTTPMNLKEVGELIGLTREMVRQIKEKSLVTMRNYMSTTP